MNADRIGIFASAVCFVHCILTPVVLSLSVVWAHYLPSEERFHRVMAAMVAAIGGFAIVTGYRKHHRRRVLFLMSAGLLLIYAGAYLGDLLPSHIGAVAVTLMGSSLMITAHLINHTFCKNCSHCNKA